jgi:hypothetical protein
LLLLALAAAGSLALSLAAFGEDPEPEPQVATVDWAERPADVAELEQASTAVVEAEVTAIEDGPRLLDPADADDPDQAIPTQRISFETFSVLEGQMPATFKLFKSDDLHLQGDPLYEVAETYVLFLEPRDGEPGTYVPSAPDGRLELDAQGEADPVIAGPVAQELEGQTPEQIEQEIDG